ncbi:MAG: hypothetical protein ABII74_07805 [Elusimicrobiota bacterium]
MQKRELLNHLKKRWEVVHDIEVKELQQTSLKERLKKTLMLFDMGINLLGLSSSKDNSEAFTVAARWQKLRNYYHETK